VYSPRKVGGSGALINQLWSAGFVLDSLLEEAGFELSVPPAHPSELCPRSPSSSPTGRGRAERIDNLANFVRTPAMPKTAEYSGFWTFGQAPEA
jgi:hypothetical protein